MTDDLLPITQFVPSEVTPAPTALQVPTQRVRDKGAVKYAGFKIAVSAHRADVETWLLQGIPYTEICRRLNTVGFSTNVLTVRKFKINYLDTIDAKVKEELVQHAKADTEANDSVVVGDITHSRISRVESLRQLLAATELKIKEMGENPGKEPKDLMAYGNYLDRMARLRGELEVVQMSSEVERERTKAITAVAECALKYLKTNENAAFRFISEVTAIKNRKDLPTDG